jgi:hypothetical protein
MTAARSIMAAAAFQGASMPRRERARPGQRLTGRVFAEAVRAVRAVRGVARAADVRRLPVAAALGEREGQMGRRLALALVPERRLVRVQALGAVERLGHAAELEPVLDLEPVQVALVALVPARGPVEQVAHGPADVPVVQLVQGLAELLAHVLALALVALLEHVPVERLEHGLAVEHALAAALALVERLEHGLAVALALVERLEHGLAVEHGLAARLERAAERERVGELLAEAAELLAEAGAGARSRRSPYCARTTFLLSLNSILVCGAIETT